MRILIPKNALVTQRPFAIVLLLVTTPLAPTWAQPPAGRPEVERLGFLVGEFAGTVRFAPPGAPAQTGPMTFRGEWDLDGWIVRARYEQRLGTSPAVGGLLIFRWRPRDSTYAFEGYANTPMDPHRLTGRWEGRLIFEGGMGNARFREVWQARGSDTLITAMEFERDGRWTPVSEAVLVRKP